MLCPLPVYAADVKLRNLGNGAVMCNHFFLYITTICEKLVAGINKEILKVILKIPTLSATTVEKARKNRTAK